MNCWDGKNFINFMKRCISFNNMSPKYLYSGVLRDLRAAFPQLLMNTNCVLEVCSSCTSVVRTVITSAKCELWGNTAEWRNLCAAQWLCRIEAHNEKYGLWKVFTLANEADGYYLLYIGNLSSSFLWILIRFGYVTPLLYALKTRLLEKLLECMQMSRPYCLLCPSI